MAIPKSKSELLAQSEANFNKLNTLIDSFSSEDQESEFAAGTMNRNIRDVVAHIHEWHMMFLDWYHVGMKGEKPFMPAKGFSWKEIKALNEKIWNAHLDASLAIVRKDLMESFVSVQAIIEKHSDVELFEKKRYKWTGSSSLGVYLRLTTSSHYDWGYKLIKKGMKKPVV